MKRINRRVDSYTQAELEAEGQRLDASIIAYARSRRRAQAGDDRLERLPKNPWPAAALKFVVLAGFAYIFACAIVGTI